MQFWRIYFWLQAWESFSDLKDIVINSVKGLAIASDRGNWGEFLHFQVLIGSCWASIKLKAMEGEQNAKWRNHLNSMIQTLLSYSSLRNIMHSSKLYPFRMRHSTMSCTVLSCTDNVTHITKSLSPSPNILCTRLMHPFSFSCLESDLAIRSRRKPTCYLGPLLKLRFAHASNNTQTQHVSSSRIF